jgi:hypothetical protein
MVELPVEDKNIAILQAAHEVLRLLGRGWAGRQAKDCEMCSYSPDVVRQYLHAFEELTASVEGIATSGVNPVTGRKHDPPRTRPSSTDATSCGRRRVASTVASTASPSSPHAAVSCATGRTPATTSPPPASPIAPSQKPSASSASAES